MVEQMIGELRTTRKSMEGQITVMSDIIDKSNNVLLQIEATRSLKPISHDSSCSHYTYNKDTTNALTTIIGKFTNLISSQSLPSEEGSQFEEYLNLTSFHTEYLGSNIRKLMAVWDTIQQMRLILMEHEKEAEMEGRNI